MSRANRHFLAGYVWHLTHRCHQKSFLLKFARDRARWIHWLGQAKRRYGLSVLNYTVTCNHIHLLVLDTGRGEIARSMQLIAGRTAQEYNRRKRRHGAFWEDRYHATAVQGDTHLLRCMTYIDLNMVRAGVVHHPKQWPHGGYQSIQNPPTRYGVIDMESLLSLCNVRDVASLSESCRSSVDEELSKRPLCRESHWTAGVAVGSAEFVGGVKRKLGSKHPGRSISNTKDTFVLQEIRGSYNAVFRA